MASAIAAENGTGVSDQRHVDLFLIGKTGTGKSTTGNAIVGREAFTESDSSSSETFEIQAASVRFHERIIKVVDSPGFFETRLEKGEAVEKMIKDIGLGIMHCPKGFHALILVIKYGNKFTEEEVQTLRQFKQSFGENVVRDFCILIFSYGDFFEKTNRRSKKQKQFSTWCKEQDGALKDLLEECNYRVVLFDNYDETKYESQMTELLALVDKLQTKGVRYTNELFQEFAKNRERLIVEQRAPELEENIQEKIDLLYSSYNRIKAAFELNLETKENLESLKKQARALDVEIVVADKGTGVLDKLRKTVGGIIDSLEDDQISLVKKIAQCEQIDAMKKENDAKMNQLKAGHDQRLDKMMSEQRELMKRLADQQEKSAQQMAKLQEQNDPSLKEELEASKKREEELNKQLLTFRFQRINSEGVIAKKGTTGKYYCGRKVLSCRCCNGFCGPNNGCNCKPCQQLDKPIIPNCILS